MRGKLVGFFQWAERYHLDRWVAAAAFVAMAVSWAAGSGDRWQDSYTIVGAFALAAVAQGPEAWIAWVGRVAAGLAAFAVIDVSFTLSAETAEGTARTGALLLGAGGAGAVRWYAEFREGRTERREAAERQERLLTEIAASERRILDRLDTLAAAQPAPTPRRGRWR